MFPQTSPPCPSSHPTSSTIPPVDTQPTPCQTPDTGTDQSGSLVGVSTGQPSGQTRPTSPVQLEEPAAKLTKA
eukprot:12374896-Karenia_brevis.AAC.1